MVRRVALAGVVMLVYAGLAITPASAANLGNAPAPSGDYAVCNVDQFAAEMLPGFPGNYGDNYRISCNYGEVAGLEATAVRIRNVANTFDVVNVGVGAGGSACAVGVGSSWTAHDSEQRFQATKCAGSGTSPAAEALGVIQVFINGVWRQASYTLSATGSQPGYPFDYFTGGMPGDAPIPPIPSGLCTRELDSPASGHAEFTVDVDNGDPGYVDEWEWDYGDGDADAGPDAVNPHVHDYDVGTQPANGWTAEATITRTGDGVDWDDTPVTGTCELRVDFYHPEADQAGTTGGGEETEFSDCVPSGWAFLNPVAYVEGMACVLQLLFIPTTFGENVEEISDAWSSSLGGTVFDAISVLWTFPADMAAQYEETGSDCEGPEVNLDFNVLGMDDLPAHPLDACTGPAASAASTFRVLTNIVLYLGIAFMVARLALSAIGAKAPTDGSDS